MAVLLPGCSAFLPESGPLASEVRKADGPTSGIQIVDLTLPNARMLDSRREPQTFGAFQSHGKATDTVGPGDVLAVTLTEAPPASLFGSGGEAGKGASTVQATTFPDQMISSAGTINIPFAGKVQAAGRTLPEIEDSITQKLKEKANQPQVLVRLLTNNTDYVTVLGAVTTSARLPLTPSRERVLDALARAGGSFDDVNKVTVQLTRGGITHSMSMGAVIKDPGQNIVLDGGDVLTVLKQPYSFTVMGATLRTEEIKLEDATVTLAQALGRAGGLNDERANARGVFIFRYETREAFDWKSKPVITVAGGKVPVVYRVDLSKPSGLFVSKSFSIHNGDILYVANAPAAELKKFLEIIGTITAPVANAAAATTTAVATSP